MLADASDRLARAGVESPAADAEWLLCHVLEIGRGQLLFVDDLDSADASRFAELIEARSQRIPLQHLTGTAAFGPLELAVGPGVFVPRPETELLYEWALGRLSEISGPARAVDLCSGSGALALALATASPTTTVEAIELSPEAGEWLRRNVAKERLTGRVHVHLGDVTDQEFVSGVTGAPVDLVVSNPPYVPTTTDVPQEVDADPAMAVFGGTDGMSVIGPMVGVIATILAPGGWVGIEHDDTTAAAVVAALQAADHGGVVAFENIEPHTDLAGRPRFVTARRTPVAAAAR